MCFLLVRLIHLWVKLISLLCGSIFYTLINFYLLKTVIQRVILKSPDMMVDLSVPPHDTTKLTLHILWLRFQNLFYLPDE